MNKVDKSKEDIKFKFVVDTVNQTFDIIDKMICQSSKLKIR